MMDIPSTSALQKGPEVDKEENKECTGWSLLPAVLLKLIMKRLYVTGYLRLRAVCKSWKATVDNAIAEKCCPPLPELPLLLLGDEIRHCMYNLSTRRLLSHERPLLRHGQIYHGSVEGWLIVSDIADNPRNSRAIFFLNPMTNARVMLPSGLNFRTNSILGKVVASSAPTCPDCLVVCSFQGDYLHLIYCRISNQSWRLIEAGGVCTNFQDMEILDGKLYVLIDMGLRSIFVYDLREPISIPQRSSIVDMLPELRAPRAFVADVASGQLFLIYTHSFVQHRILRLQVYQLDTRTERPQWVKVDSLGDRMLFYSSMDSKVMSTSASLNGPQEVIRGNCVCFTTEFPCPADPWRRGVNFVVYSLADRMFRYFSLEQSSFVNPPLACWFIPKAW